LCVFPLFSIITATAELLHLVEPNIFGIFHSGLNSDVASIMSMGMITKTFFFEDLEPFVNGTSALFKELLFQYEVMNFEVTIGYHNSFILFSLLTF